MKRGLFLLALLFCACATPCDRLSETTCKAQGEGSAACKEVRSLVDKAGDDDQEHCRAALTILEGGSP
jgi:hypothetical protein